MKLAHMIRSEEEQEHFLYEAILKSAYVEEGHL